MIDVSLCQRGERLCLTVMGHAGYAPHGRDIVCAGVSSLCMALAKYTNFRPFFGNCFPQLSVLCPDKRVSAEGLRVPVAASFLDLLFFRRKVGKRTLYGFAIVIVLSEQREAFIRFALSFITVSARCEHEERSKGCESDLSCREQNITLCGSRG